MIARSLRMLIVELLAQDRAQAGLILATVLAVHPAEIAVFAAAQSVKLWTW